MILHMTSNATGSGMGTAGLVGQIMTWQTMTAVEPPMIVLIKIIVIQIALPAIVTLLISEFMRKKKWNSVWRYEIRIIRADEEKLSKKSMKVYDSLFGLWYTIVVIITLRVR